MLVDMIVTIILINKRTNEGSIKMLINSGNGRATITTKITLPTTSHIYLYIGNDNISLSIFNRRYKLTTHKNIAIISVDCGGKPTFKST